MCVGLIAGLTFREAARKRLLLLAMLAGFGFLALYGAGVHFQNEDLQNRHIPAQIGRQEHSITLMMGLYSIDMLVVMMTILTAVDTLSGEISSGAIQAVATKPVRRWELVTGKWLGFAGMLTLYIVLMAGGIDLLTYLMTGVAARHPWTGFGLIWLEGLVLLSVTLLFGTMFSTLTNGVFALGLHGVAFMAGWIEQAGAATRTPRVVRLGVIVSLVMPSETLWRRAAYEMQTPLASALDWSPFSGMSVPSPSMIAYAGAYMVAAFGLAIWRFQRRDL